MINKKEVIRLMREGWECAYSLYVTGTGGRYWLQQGKIGYGGKTYEINSKTFNGMKLKGLIESLKRHFPHNFYTLTELGKKIQL